MKLIIRNPNIIESGGEQIAWTVAIVALIFNTMYYKVFQQKSKQKHYKVFQQKM